MKLYRSKKGILLHHAGNYYPINESWDLVVNRASLYDFLNDLSLKNERISEEEAMEYLRELLAPIGQQEVWAAGVTYLRSRDARIEESIDSGGSDLYDRVYDATRPELFFKSLPHRVAGHQQSLYIRRDSDWNVPEPELTLFINSGGSIQGYTIGNDMSSRSIEGENALYLPQAKIYERSAALGPCLYVPSVPLNKEIIIEMDIIRNGKKLFHDSISVTNMKRSFSELTEFLYRACDFSFGTYLMTGTCLVPPNEFTLQEHDLVTITIQPIGILSNMIFYKP